MQEWIPIEKFSEMIDTPKRTVSDWCREGKVRCFQNKKERKKYYIHREELKKYQVIDAEVERVPVEDPFTSASKRLGVGGQSVENFSMFRPTETEKLLAVVINELRELRGELAKMREEKNEYLRQLVEIRKEVRQVEAPKAVKKYKLPEKLPLGKKATHTPVPDWLPQALIQKYENHVSWREMGRRIACHKDTLKDIASGKTKEVSVKRLRKIVEMLNGKGAK